MTGGPVARDGATGAFFDAAVAGRFLIRRCGNGHAAGPRTGRCPECGSAELAEESASGKATLVSWAVVPARLVEGSPEGEAEVPAIVELVEGPWWWTRIVGVPPADLSEGLALRVVFEQAEGGEPVPVFTAGP